MRRPGHGGDTVVAKMGPLQVDVFADDGIARKFYDSYGFAPVKEHVHEKSGKITIKLVMPGALSTEH